MNRDLLSDPWRRRSDTVAAMPNFVPVRDYTMKLIDEMIGEHGLSAPFIDIGCGQGDVSLHLSRRHSWEGIAADSSEGAAAAARRQLAGTRVAVDERPLGEILGEFRTVVMSTVIEHIEDDHAAIAQVRGLLPDSPGGGHLIISMPTNPTSEWRWDDDFYGHYRRYTRASVDHLLSSNGFEMLEFWDYTFPFFWAMRRAYTRAMPAKRPLDDVKEVNTADSSLSSAWEAGTTTSVLSRVPVWPLVQRLQKRYRDGDRGFEAIALAVTK
jgi:SAM-dependent methyltransferase